MISSIREATETPIKILIGGLKTLIDIDIIDILYRVLKT